MVAKIILSCKELFWKKQIVNTDNHTLKVMPITPKNSNTQADRASNDPIDIKACADRVR